jgi:glycosyltransferase involved in cell wall biosynthesis
MPAYYEGDLIAQVITQTQQAIAHVVVIDDGSQDDTYVNACQTQAIVLKHVVNLGQGAALQTGFEFALSQGAKYVITFDSDGQHRVSDALMMLNTLCQKRKEALSQNRNDYPRVALGSRFLGGTINMPASRKFILKLAIAFTRLTSHISLTDTHNGLRVIDCEVLPKLRITQNRMAHASEILHQLQVNRIPLVELPVVIEYNERSLAKGQSALNAINIVFDLLMKRLFGA